MSGSVPERWRASLGLMNSGWLHVALKGEARALHVLRLTDLPRLWGLCGLPVCVETGGGMQILLPLPQCHQPAAFCKLPFFESEL